MQAFWSYLRRHDTAVATVPVIVAIALALVTGRAFLLSVGVVWFLSVIAISSGTDTLDSVRHKLPRQKRGALVSFLQYGGYSIAASSMACYFALVFWTSYRPKWLMELMFAGVLMFFCSGFVHKARSQGRAGKHNEPGGTGE